MNGVAWINLARGVFIAVKIWVDPEYERERDLIIQDFQHNVVRPFRQGYYGASQPKRMLVRKPFKIALYILLALAAICIVLGGHQ
ncbi:MAG TPA: hypothetical protein VFN26_23630 [Candidatus Acidoferrum sp.]|nr:hypothetical protein [Candidatus Acidoferrum sp.]